MSGTKTDGFVTVAKVGEIPEGGVKVTWLDDQPVAVFHVGGEYYAMDDLCTHDGGGLGPGRKALVGVCRCRAKVDGRGEQRDRG